MTNQADVKTKSRLGPFVEPDQFEFAIICALPREFDAVETSLDEIYDAKITPQKEFDSNFYKRGRIGPFHVVVACLPEMGKESAASAASNLRISFPNIGLTFVVGICGGVPYPSADSGVEMIMGDVIISHRIIRFDFGRQYPDRFEQRGGVQDTLDRSNRSIRSLISGLQTRSTNLEFQEMHLRYLREFGEKSSVWEYPGVEKDLLFPLDYEGTSQCEDIQVSPIERKRLMSEDHPEPRLHFGPIASSDTVMKSGKHRDELARKSQVIGFEMEGSGVCNHLSCVIIKGVCDYSDGHKTKVWQDYAAASAASAAKSVLELLATKRYGSFVYCKTVQTGSVASSVASVSGSSSREWQMSPTYSKNSDIDQHIQSVSEGLHRMAEEIPDLLMRRTLVSAASGVVKSSSAQIQSLPKNRIFQSKPYKTLFGKVILRTQMIEHTISVGGESSVQTETQSSFIFHPAPWLLRLGIRYGLKAMAVNHNRTWQYSISPINVRPDDSIIFRLCETGNTAAVRELFAMQQASVYDVDTSGMSLLHIAAEAGHFDLARFLILQNANKQAYLYHAMLKNRLEPASYLPYCTYSKPWPQLFSLFRDCIEFSDEDSVGWQFLNSMGYHFMVEMAGSDNQIQRYRPLITQSCPAWLPILLDRFQEESPTYISYPDIELSLWISGIRKDLDSIRLILNFDPQGSIYACSGQVERPPRSYTHFLVFQVLAEEGYDIRSRLHGDTLTSRSLKFSGLFYHWREDVRLFYNSLDHLIECETHDSPDVPSLRGRYSHLLRNLFWLYLPPHHGDQGHINYYDLLKDVASFNLLPPDGNERSVKFGIYHALHKEIECTQCGYSCLPCDFDGIESGFMIEPWWEGVKCSVQNGECLCLMGNSLYDWRDQNDIRHRSSCFKGSGPGSGSEGERDHLVDTQSPETQEIRLQTNFDFDDDSLQGSEPVFHSSNCLDGAAAPLVQIEGPSGHRWDEINHFTSWTQQCYIKYGGWKLQYQRDEYICFLCLALKEGWKEEHREVCRYLELSEESERNKAGGDESD